VTEAAKYFADVQAAGRVIVWDESKQEHIDVAPAEAAQGMLRYARRLRLGSEERGEIERQAIDLLEQAGEWPPWKRRRARRG
jgi:hypothetical protein